MDVNEQRFGNSKMIYVIKILVDVNVWRESMIK